MTLASRSMVLASGLVAAVAWSPASHAGGGPWTLNPGERNIYVGLDYFRFARFAGGSGQTLAAYAPTTGAGVTGVWTLGLTYDLEAEFKVAYETMRLEDPTVDLCTRDGLPGDWCDDTRGLGDITGQIKWRMVDEVYASPVSVSSSLLLRSGEPYAEYRRRYTSLGDAMTDVGLGLSVGRTDTIGQHGWYTSHIAAWYHYRLGTREGPNQPKLQSDEVSFEGEAVISVLPRVGIGPAAYGFVRLGGIDFVDVDYADHAIWGKLDAHQVKGGAKAFIYGLDGGPTVAFTVLRTVYARNNPADTWTLSVGVGWFTRPETEQLTLQ